MERPLWVPSQALKRGSIMNIDLTLERLSTTHHTYHTFFIFICSLIAIVSLQSIQFFCKYPENIDLIFFQNPLRTINNSSTWIQMTLKHHPVSSRIFFVPAHFAANRSCVVLCIRSMETAAAFAWWMVNDETIPYQTLLQNSTTLKTLKTVI